MKTPKLPPLPLLAASMKLEGPRGMCIHRSAAFVFDVPGATMMFGTFDPIERDGGPLPGDSAVPFIHAWAEFKGFVYAPTTIERCKGQLIAQHREGYYRVNGARDFRILTRPQLLRLDKQVGLRRQLRLGVPLKGGASFGGTLMDAAGVDYRVTSDGGVVPSDVYEEGESA